MLGLTEYERLLMSNVIQKSRKQNFTTVPNELLNCMNVTLSAKGLYAFMFSKPDGWNFTIRSMTKQLKEGAAAISSSLDCLKEYGWLAYQKHRDGTGTYFLNWEPFEHIRAVNQNTENQNQIEPKLGNPNMGIPNMGKPKRISNTDLFNKKDTRNIVSIEDSFEIFYQAGMRKLNKKAALKAFAKQVKERKVCPTEFANMLADDVRKRVAAQQMGFDAMHPTTYLNNERWEDEIVQRQEQQAGPEKQFDNWYASDAGIDRKAKELGITPRATESYKDLKDRIQAHLKAGQRSTYQQDAQTTIYQELNDDDIPY